MAIRKRKGPKFSMVEEILERNKSVEQKIKCHNKRVEAQIADEKRKKAYMKAVYKLLQDENQEAELNKDFNSKMMEWKQELNVKNIQTNNKKILENNIKTKKRKKHSESLEEDMENAK